jgi:5-methylcytosine-specific restriction protein A
MPLRPCLGVYGHRCPKLTTAPALRCADCDAAFNQRREAARPSWATRYGNDWQRKAKRFVTQAKAEGRGCVYCGQTGDYDEAEQLNPLQAGHIVAREDGGSNDLDNVQLECRRCNVRKKRSRRSW